MEMPPEAAAPASPAAASQAGSRSAWSSVAPVPESAPEAALTLDALQQQLEALKELQRQYLQGQRRVRRTCQHFPRSVRALSLQVCHARRRLVRIEVRLKRQEGEGPPSPAGPVQLPRLEGCHAWPAAALPHKPVSPVASDSQGTVSTASSLSGVSLPLQPFPPPPPLQPDPSDLKEALATLVELQAHHLQDRKRDLRGCQECLKSIRALRVQLRNVRNRLWALEAKLGIQVPPRELDADEQEEEEEEQEKEEPALPPGGLDTSGDQREEMST